MRAILVQRSAAYKYRGDFRRSTSSAIVASLISHRPLPFNTSSITLNYSQKPKILDNN